MLRAVVVVLASTLLLPAAAQASTAEVARFAYCCEGFSEPGVQVSGAPGEANRIRLERRGGFFVVRDDGAPLEAGEGCSATAPGEVVCPIRQSAPGTRLELLRTSLGDGDDELLLTGDAGTNAVLDGGPGRDRIAGGPAAEIFDGGPGADTIDGGAGVDTVNYFSGLPQQVAVQVDLDRGRGGPPGETDRLTGIEAVRGTDRDDVIAGDDRRNHIDGGAGDDRLLGMGGDDVLDGSLDDDDVQGGPGDDTIRAFDDYLDDGEDRLSGGAGEDDIEDNADGVAMFGGPGDDKLTGFGRMVGGDGDDQIDTIGPSRISGGAGDDLIRGDDPDSDDEAPDVIDAGPGDDRIDGGGFGDRVDAGPGRDRVVARRRDRVSCGAGRDLVFAAPRAHSVRRCERRRRLTDSTPPL